MDVTVPESAFAHADSCVSCDIDDLILIVF